MSVKRFDKIWEPEYVFPYLKKLYDCEDVVKKYISEKMYLVGSRGKTPLDEWDKLKGKDWDVLIETNRIIRHPNLLVEDNYNVDILVIGPEKIIEAQRKNRYNGCKGGIEIFPNTPEEFKKYLIIK